jgi:hypothetical protein
MWIPDSLFRPSTGLDPVLVIDYEAFSPKVMNGTVAKNMRQIQGKYSGLALPRPRKPSAQVIVEPAEVRQEESWFRFWKESSLHASENVFERDTAAPLASYAAGTGPAVACWT